MGPKCVQLCKENPYFEVFITNFHAVAGHVWLAERGPRGGRDFVFEGMTRDKASSRACRAMLTPTTTLAGPNESCLTMYTCKVWSESTSEAFHRLYPHTTHGLSPASATLLGGLAGDPQKNHSTGGCRAIEAATTTPAVIIGSCLTRSGDKPSSDSTVGGHLGGGGGILSGEVQSMKRGVLGEKRGAGAQVWWGTA